MGIKLKQRDQFKYFGTLISSAGRSNTEIASTQRKQKRVFRERKVSTNILISIQSRRAQQECYIELILVYGCEDWIIPKQVQKKPEATEM